MTHEEYVVESKKLDKEIVAEEHRHIVAVQELLRRRIELNLHEATLRGHAEYHYGV